MTSQKYKTFDDLPEWAKTRIRLFRGDPEEWIYEPVPLLNDRSFIDVINEDESGERKVKIYLNRVMGKFFDDLDIPRL